MNEVLIRTVIKEDINACSQIEALCFEPSEAASYEKIRCRQQQYPIGFLVAELEGNVIGFINCGATNEPDLADEEFKDMIGHDEDGKNLVIFSLAVHPDFQRSGVAGKLITLFSEQAKDHHKQSILLLCKSHLIVFYEQFGFENMGQSASEHGGFSWWEMSKLLDIKKS